MTLDMIDLVWSLMTDNELYSPTDLANILGQSTDTMVRIFEFLVRHEFIERVSKSARQVAGLSLVSRRRTIGPTLERIRTVVLVGIVTFLFNGTRGFYRRSS
jgi:hypothetical protein